MKKGLLGLSAALLTALFLCSPGLRGDVPPPKPIPDIRGRHDAINYTIQIRNDYSGGVFPQPYTAIFFCYETSWMGGSELTWSAVFNCDDPKNAGRTHCTHNIAVNSKLEPLVSADRCRAQVIMGDRLYEAREDYLNAGGRTFPMNYPYVSPLSLVVDLRINKPVDSWTAQEPARQ